MPAFDVYTGFVKLIEALQAGHGWGTPEADLMQWLSLSDQNRAVFYHSETGNCKFTFTRLVPVKGGAPLMAGESASGLTITVPPSGLHLIS